MKHKAISILVVTNPMFHLAATTLPKRWLLQAFHCCGLHSPRKVTWKSVQKMVANHPDALVLLTSKELYWHFVHHFFFRRSKMYIWKNKNHNLSLGTRLVYFKLVYYILYPYVPSYIYLFVLLVFYINQQNLICKHNEEKIKFIIKIFL
jgi:hypothetical protein